MNYAQVRKFDVANGTGIRTSLFVSGCTHNCPSCFNRDYQDFNYGLAWNRRIEEQLLDYVADKNVVGLSLLGGEPFQNTRELINLTTNLKKRYPNKTIWVWSGYTYEEIVKDQYKLGLLKNCDVLVDGRFIEELKDITLRFRGSSNQRIINVQLSLEEGVVVLYEFCK
ncbi:MAG: anaerobic ribonucleoside-triphosphate reductase activating protein [Synergistaceae bacterium]